MNPEKKSPEQTFNEQAEELILYCEDFMQASLERDYAATEFPRLKKETMEYNYWKSQFEKHKRQANAYEAWLNNTDPGVIVNADQKLAIQARTITIAEEEDKEEELDKISKIRDILRQTRERQLAKI